MVEYSITGGLNVTDFANHTYRFLAFDRVLIQQDVRLWKSLDLHQVISFVFLFAVIIITILFKFLLFLCFPKFRQFFLAFVSLIDKNGKDSFRRRIDHALLVLHVKMVDLIERLLLLYLV